MLTEHLVGMGSKRQVKDLEELFIEIKSFWSTRVKQPKQKSGLDGWSKAADPGDPTLLLRVKGTLASTEL